MVCSDHKNPKQIYLVFEHFHEIRHIHQEENQILAFVTQHLFQDFLDHRSKFGAPKMDVVYENKGMV